MSGPSSPNNGYLMNGMSGNGVTPTLHMLHMVSSHQNLNSWLLTSFIQKVMNDKTDADLTRLLSSWMTKLSNKPSESNFQVDNYYDVIHAYVDVYPKVKTFYSQSSFAVLYIGAYTLEPEKIYILRCSPYDIVSFLTARNRFKRTVTKIFLADYFWKLF